MPVAAPETTADRLVATARAMLDESGLDGLTLRAIARRAALSHGAPRNHFPTLASLLAAVAATGFRDLIAAVDTSVGAADATARERLAASGRGYVGFAVANPGVFSVMFRPELVDTDDEHYRRAGADSFAQLVALVAAAQRDGFHAGTDTTRLASVIWSTNHGLAALWIEGGGSLPGATGDFGLHDFVALTHSIVLGPTSAQAPTSGRSEP